MKQYQYIICLLLSLPAMDLFAQKADTLLELVPLQETVISAVRNNEARTTVAQQNIVIKKATIEQMNAQSTADMLLQTGQVFVQKSQQGGGSPVLRGFEASRVLLVVDGVRLNNAIYRAGHLQNVITLDNNSLERAEVLFGPASTVYGSDALGGAICFYTKNPVMAAPGEKIHQTGNALVRYGSVNQEKTAHVDFSMAGQKFGSFTSLNYSDFGDLKMGKQNGLGAFFGLRNEYVERIAGVDKLVRNADPYVQRFSGYQQYDLVQKFRWVQNENNIHTLNIQYSTSSDIPRYDRLTDPDPNTGLRSAEWYYGPQNRSLAAYTYTRLQAGWFDRINVAGSWQAIEESRNSRRFGRDGLQSRTEHLNVFGLTADAQRSRGIHTLRMGLDAQSNLVQSTAQETNILTQVSSPLDTRYPNGGSNMTNAALYATHNWKPNEQLIISEGLRVGYSRLQTSFSDKTFFPFPFDDITQQYPVFAGNLGLVWNTDADWRIIVNASSGFRAPNVDDLGKVFESTPGSLIVPNPDLKPEKTFNLDLGFSRTIAGRFDWETTIWGTSFQNAIVTSNFQLNGQDSVVYDGALSRVLANQNTGSARIWGISTDIEADIYDHLAVHTSLTYTRGDITSEEELQPLDHISPLYGSVGLRFHESNYVVEAYALFNGAKPLDRYSNSGEDNLQYAPANGIPAWFTLNLKGSLRLQKHIRIQAGLENILDTQYRVFSSGINSPGRNLYVSVRCNW
ncbi:MAG: TonB-dependent receptor [Lewinellaceae bacterium]|nr:TonB-dependent receptor [Lewinellaceae bacterium]